MIPIRRDCKTIPPYWIFEEESSIGESSEDSLEIMGILLGNFNKEGLQDNPNISHNKPLV